MNLDTSQEANCTLQCFFKPILLVTKKSVRVGLPAGVDAGETCFFSNERFGPFGGRWMGEMVFFARFKFSESF